MVDDDDDDSERRSQHQHPSLQRRQRNTRSSSDTHTDRRHQHDLRSGLDKHTRYFETFLGQIPKRSGAQWQAAAAVGPCWLLMWITRLKTVDPSSVCLSENRCDPELQRVLLTTNLIISVSRFSSMWIFSSSMTVNWISLGCGHNETFEDDIFHLFLMTENGFIRLLVAALKKIITRWTLDICLTAVHHTVIITVMITPVTLMHLFEITPTSDYIPVALLSFQNTCCFSASLRNLPHQRDVLRG